MDKLWDLTGIPCSHAICALKHAKQDPKAFISKWYHKSSYMASYEHVIEVMAGKLVKESDRFEKLEPPPTKKLPGRPPKRRIRGFNEARKRKNVEIELGKATGRLPKKGLVIRCSICHSTGHNRAKCPNKNSQNSCITSGSNTQSEAKSQSVQAKVIRKNKRPTGLGILIDENSGNMILNYPIPNERELRQTTQTSRGLRSTGSRKITFIGDGSNSTAVGQLPFKPPGLKWNGKRSITTTQLENEREKKKAMKGNTSKSWI
ncbi:hypothetical protein C2S52_003157 [Perilla frutescens var. hirtella]|nr:hypothetical protein C2S52_003157 [Perilla frutescens var. hirtella]